MEEQDGLVEDVLENVNHQQQNQPPITYQNCFYFIINSIVYTFETYGWFILIGSILAYYIYTHLKDKWAKIAEKKPPKVDEEEALRLAERIELARQRQQAAFEANKAKYLEEKRIKEEKAALEKAEEWERHKQGLGYRSKIKKDENDELARMGLAPNATGKKKPKLRDPDYNPLTGSSSSSNSCGFRRRDFGPRSGG